MLHRNTWRSEGPACCAGQKQGSGLVLWLERGMAAVGRVRGNAVCWLLLLRSAKARSVARAKWECARGSKRRPRRSGTVPQVTAGSGPDTEHLRVPPSSAHVLPKRARSRDAPSGSRLLGQRRRLSGRCPGTSSFCTSREVVRNALSRTPLGQWSHGPLGRGRGRKLF